VGKTVDVEVTDKFLKIFLKGEQIALHKRITLKGKFSTVAEHYPDFKVFNRDWYQNISREKVDIIGPYCAKLFTRIIEKQPRYWIRTVKGILSP